MRMSTYRNPRLMIVVMLALIGCAHGAGDREAASLEQQAWKSIRAGALLVDVRTPEEYAQGHIDGALNIPYDEISARRDELGTALDRPLVLYCRTGRRADIAKKMLEGLGFTNILNARSYEALKAAQ